MDFMNDGCMHLTYCLLSSFVISYFAYDSKYNIEVWILGWYHDDYVIMLDIVGNFTMMMVMLG